MISTSWFACCFSSLDFPSRRYVEPLVPVALDGDVALALLLAVPLVDPADEEGEDDVAEDEDGEDADDGDEEDDELEPILAFDKTNCSAVLEPAVALDDPAPEVPTAPPIRSACCRQPVIVMVLAPLRLDWFDAVELPLLDCPAAPVPNASASAATPPIHTLRFMPPPFQWSTRAYSNFRSTRKRR